MGSGWRLDDVATRDNANLVSLLLERGAAPNPNLAPVGEAMIDIARSNSLRALLEEYGGRSGLTAR
ncbi:MAG: hypothetical protein ABGX04_09345 [Myxococcales bacterium]